MKKSESFKSLLGLTREQLSQVLGVGHSRLAKYEKGMRSLPLESNQLLAELITYMCGTEPPVAPQDVAFQESEKQNTVQRMLKENRFQIENTKRQIEKVEKKYNININALQLVEFLSKHNDGQTVDANVLQEITTKAQKSLKTNGLAKLFRLQVKLEMLEKEKEVLNGAL